MAPDDRCHSASTALAFVRRESLAGALRVDLLALSLHHVEALDAAAQVGGERLPCGIHARERRRRGVGCDVDGVERHELEPLVRPHGVRMKVEAPRSARGIRDTVRDEVSASHLRRHRDERVLCIEEAIDDRLLVCEGHVQISEQQEPAIVERVPQERPHVVVRRDRQVKTPDLGAVRRVEITHLKLRHFDLLSNNKLQLLATWRARPVNLLPAVTTRSRLVQDKWLARLVGSGRGQDHQKRVSAPRANGHRRCFGDAEFPGPSATPSLRSPVQEWPLLSGPQALRAPGVGFSASRPAEQEHQRPR